MSTEILHRVSAAALCDEVEGALDYQAITKAMIEHVEQGRPLPLERLAHDLIAICTRHPAVPRAVVSVDMPHALRSADSISLTLEHDKRQARSMNKGTNEYVSRPFSEAS